MARRLAYTGPLPITAQEFADWRRMDVADVQGSLLLDVIIPGVTAQCEARTGAAIRAAKYVEDWPTHYPSGHALDVGQAKEVESIELVQPDGTTAPAVVPFYLSQGQRESALHFPSGRPEGVLRITYLAGVDLLAYPAVKNWLLLQAGTVDGQRESLIIGATVAELPSSFLDSMLSEITIPPRF